MTVMLKLGQWMSIGNIRQKLGDYGSCIKTIRGLGYKFVEKESSHERAILSRMVILTLIAVLISSVASVIVVYNAHLDRTSLELRADAELSWL